MAAAAEPGPVEAAIGAALQAAFEPAHLEVINESAAHNVAPGSETVRALIAARAAPARAAPARAAPPPAHPPRRAPAAQHFKVIVVAAAFEAAALLERHRSVNAALAEQLAGPVHALSIVAKTPEQWAKTSGVTPSPACLGGSKR